MDTACSTTLVLERKTQTGIHFIQPLWDVSVWAGHLNFPYSQEKKDDAGKAQPIWIIWTPNYGREDWGLTNLLFSTDDKSSLHTSPACTRVPSSYLKPGEMNTVLCLWEPWVTTWYRLYLWGQRKPSAPRTTCFCFGEWCLRWLASASQLSNTLIQKATSDSVSSWPVSF